MNFNQFTIKAQEAVQEAVNLTQARGQQAIEPVHLLQSVMKVGENVTNFIFQKLGMNGQQIALVLDKQSGKLENCLPSDLKNELDGVAFKASLGEFSFMAVPSEGFVSRGDLYLDLLQIVLNAAEVKKLIVVPFNEEYGKEVENVLRECALENAGHKEEAKDIVYFRMEEPAAPAVCRWEMLGYPLMSVLGIRSEDLQNN